MMKMSFKNKSQHFTLLWKQVCRYSDVSITSLFDPYHIQLTA